MKRASPLHDLPECSLIAGYFDDLCVCGGGEEEEEGSGGGEETASEIVERTLDFWAMKKRKKRCFCLGCRIDRNEFLTEGLEA